MVLISDDEVIWLCPVQAVGEEKNLAALTE